MISGKIIFWKFLVKSSHSDLFKINWSSTFFSIILDWQQIGLKLFITWLKGDGFSDSQQEGFVTSTSQTSHLSAKVMPDFSHKWNTSGIPLVEIKIKLLNNMTKNFFTFISKLKSHKNKPLSYDLSKIKSCNYQKFQICLMLSNHSQHFQIYNHKPKQLINEISSQKQSKLCRNWRKITLLKRFS